MAADIHAVAIVANGAGNAADALRSFENDGVDAGAALQFQSSGETGGTGTNNDSSFHALVGSFCGPDATGTEKGEAGMGDAPESIDGRAISSMFFVSMRKGQLEVGSGGCTSGTWRMLGLAGTDDPAAPTASSAFLVKRLAATPPRCSEPDSVTVEAHARSGAGGAETVGAAELGIG
jgi:hypothetical protein